MSTQNFKDALRRIEAREQHAKRRAILFTIIPATLVIALVIFASIQVDRAAAEVRTLKLEVDSLQAQILLSSDVLQHVHYISLTSLKYLNSRDQRQADLLSYILELKGQDVGWDWGGNSPEEGFNSPNFAIHVLKELGYLTGPVRPKRGHTRSDWLLDRVSESTELKIGDLMFYPNGHVLFYFVDENRAPYVIGMTPFGIVSLEPDFETILGHGAFRQ